MARAPIHALILILLAAAAIRIAAISVPRMNVDEGWTYYLCRNSTEVIVANLVKDRHPPLCYLTMHAWIELGDHGETRLRLPYAIGSWLAVLLVFLLAREMFGVRVGLGAALLSAVSFLGWEYETWLRNYAHFSVFSLASTWLFLRCQREGRPALWAAYVVCSTLLLYSHYFGFMVLVAHFVWALSQRRLSRWLIGSWIACALLFLPWVPHMMAQGSSRAQRDLHGGATPGAALALLPRLLPMVTGLEHVPAVLGAPEGQAAFDGAVTVAVAMLAGMGLWSLRGSPQLTLLLLLLLPYGLLVLVTAKFPEMARPRYYASMIPYVGMLLAAGCVASRRSRPLAAALAVAILAVNVAVVVDYVRSPYFRSADWLTPAKWAREREPAARGIVVHQNFAQHAFNYYYAGDTVIYDGTVPTAAEVRFLPEYAAQGRLPQYRLWDEEVPDIVATRLRGVDQLLLVFWYAEGSPLHQWLAGRYGVLDELIVPNYAADGRARLYLARRLPR